MHQALLECGVPKERIVTPCEGPYVTIRCARANAVEKLKSAGIEVTDAHAKCGMSEGTVRLAVTDVDKKNL